MDPAYRNMHSYPYQRDQMHYAPHFYPAPEPIPTQIYTSPSGRPPINYGCWPWGSSYGCHGCCNHPYFTNHYTFGSPYSHYVPPPQCPVSYPYFPVQYVPPPPPCYPVEHPRYEFEKNMPMGRQHCCGCPNHKPQQKEQENVRIGEEEFPKGRKKSDSLVPLQIENGTYPVVWMPPSDYSNEKEQCNDDSNNNSGVRRDRMGNGWYPLDLTNMVSSKKQMGDEEMKQKQDDDDGKGRFPLPLFWVPYKPEGKDLEIEKCNLKDLNTKPRLELEKGSRGEKKFHVIGEDIGGQVASRVKDIKVKEVEEQEEKENVKNQDAFVKDSIDNGAKKVDNGQSKFSKERVERKSSSPQKSSNLSPVCLRVDPLPRRKTGNGSSFSPSPPGDKQKPDLAKSKVLNSSDNNKLDKIRSNEFKEGKGMKTIEVVDGNNSGGKNVDVNVEICVNQPEEKRKEGNNCREFIGTDVIKSQSEEAESAMGRNEELFRAREGRADEAKTTSKRKLPDEEAAVIIQSAYRGFDTRKWEPLKKLKQIAEVQEQTDNVKHMIQAMESSSDIKDISKRRNIISESIMSLLLKLDTIQGLHPSIREVRKSVVKELVSLQGKLDSIMTEKPRDPLEPELESILRNQDEASNKIEDVKLSKNGNEAPSNSPKAVQNPPNGASDSEKLENPDGEEKIAKEYEKNNGGNENNEISTAKDDHGDDLYAPVNTDQKTVDIESENNEIDFLTEKEMPTRLLREGDLEQDVIEVKDKPEKNVGSDYVENVGALEGENEDGETAADKGEGDVLAEKNRELIEENERLRGVMENMIKSGQEQLTAITRLNGRVQGLERKLSKKKKLSKAKTRKSNKMRTVVFDEE